MSSTMGYLLPGVPLLGGADLTLGASASVFGLLGALVAYGKLRGSSAETSQALGYAGALFLFGLVMPGVDNWAHAGGFGGGYLAARWLDPWKPERIDHLVGALICLALSALAIVVSLVHFAVKQGQF
jgi:rhomboid protease GluP